MTAQAERTVADISDADLVLRAVSFCKAKRAGQPRWVAVSETFGLGSTYSRQLCVKHGVDPDGKAR